MPVLHLLAAWRSCVEQLSKPTVIGLFAVLLGLQGCAGSSVGFERGAAFVMQTPYGSVGVSTRQPLPGMTADESAALVRAGMQEALPGMRFSVPADGRQLPVLRLVWHVNPRPPSGGTATVVLNVFAGKQPVWFEESAVAGDCTAAGLTSTVARMTQRAAAVAVSMAPGGLV